MTKVYMEDRDTNAVIAGAKAVMNVPNPSFIYKNTQTNEPFWTDVVDTMTPFEKTRQADIDFADDKWQKIAKGLNLMVEALGWELLQVTGFNKDHYKNLVERINKAVPAA